MAYYRDLREYLQTLEERGKLVRIKSQINKDTQMHPLVRLQFRGLPEKQRKAFLFENIVDSRGQQFDSPVLIAALAGSSEIYGIGMMCKPGEIAEKFNQARLHPIEPKIVDNGPVYEEVHVGDSLLEHGGLDEFPIPISTPGFDVAPYMSAPSVITKDPETGIRNVGMYRVQIKAPLRTGMFYGAPIQGGAIHWRKCRERGIPQEAAIVIGAPPSVTYLSATLLPRDEDELRVAGGIAGKPLELVRCKTVDLEVPAHAEVVIEGEVSTSMAEPEAPFGEATDFVGLANVAPFFTVKCIAHRKQPIWVSLISQYSPSEGSKLTQPVYEALIYKHLRDNLNMSHVSAVAGLEIASSSRMIIIQMEKTDPTEVWRTLEAVGNFFPPCKIIVAVDEDVNPRDIEAVSQAICRRMMPHRDCRIVRTNISVADLSLAAIGDLKEGDFPLSSTISALGKTPEAGMEKPIEASRLLIDTTIKWAYPPISLPKKEFMDEALRLWQKEGLPELELKEPWWGYTLGYWSPEDDENANLATNGEYYQTGDIYAQKRMAI
jgi:4-hydroxy-3-polyprenylbenzoate decarboxylase